MLPEVRPVADLGDEAARVAAGVDALFLTYLRDSGDGRDRLFAAMRHAALGVGKKLRPLLTVATAKLFKLDEERALRAGTAIEAIHVYSLIHDDLPCMDDDDVRRGRPTVHRAFDEATAVLAGDCFHDPPSKSCPTPPPTRTRSSAPSWCSSWLAPPGRRGWAAVRCSTSPRRAARSTWRRSPGFSSSRPAP